jgi:hypothetical protein
VPDADLARDLHARPPVEVITYRPSRSRGRLLGCLVVGAVVIGAVGVAMSLGMGWLALAVIPAGTAPELRLAAYGAPGLFLAVTAALIGVAATLARSARDQRVELTPDQLVVVAGRRPDQRASVRLADVVRATMQYTPDHRPWSEIDTGHFVLRVEDSAGGRVDLDMSYGSSYLAVFDVRPILRDLLPRLPPDAEIDPRLRAIVEDGSLGLVKASLG